MTISPARQSDVDVAIIFGIPQHVLDRNLDLMNEARGYLEQGNHPCTTVAYGRRMHNRLECSEDHFKDLVISLQLRDLSSDQGQPLYHKFIGTNDEVKGMINPNLVFPSKENCVIYGMGIHDDSTFEQYMSQYCDHVHAFDYTVDTASPVVERQIIFVPSNLHWFPNTN